MRHHATTDTAAATIETEVTDITNEAVMTIDRRLPLNIEVVAAEEAEVAEEEAAGGGDRPFADEAPEEEEAVEIVIIMTTTIVIMETAIATIPTTTTIVRNDFLLQQRIVVRAIRQSHPKQRASTVDTRVAKFHCHQRRPRRHRWHDQEAAAAFRMTDTTMIEKTAALMALQVVVAMLEMIDTEIPLIVVEEVAEAADEAQLFRMIARRLNHEILDEEVDFLEEEDEAAVDMGEVGGRTMEAEGEDEEEIETLSEEIETPSVIVQTKAC